MFDQHILTIFSLDLFKQMVANENISLLKLNTFTTILISNNIPFDISFSNGTRRDAPGIELTIYINPTTTLVINVDLGPGGSVYTNQD